MQLLYLYLCYTQSYTSWKAVARASLVLVIVVCCCHASVYYPCFPQCIFRSTLSSVVLWVIVKAKKTNISVCDNIRRFIEKQVTSRYALKSRITHIYVQFASNTVLQRYKHIISLDEIFKRKDVTYAYIIFFTDTSISFLW